MKGEIVIATMSLHGLRNERTDDDTKGRENCHKKITRANKVCHSEFHIVRSFVPYEVKAFSSDYYDALGFSLFMRIRYFVAVCACASVRMRRLESPSLEIAF